MSIELMAEARSLADKRAELKTWLDSKKNADSGTYDLDGQGVEEFNRRNDELNTCAKSYEQRVAVAKAAAENDEALKALNAPVGRLQMGDGDELC